MQWRYSGSGFTGYELGMLVAGFVAWPLVAPQIGFLVSVFQGGDLGSLLLPLFILIFLVSAGATLLLMWGQYVRDRLALGLSAVVFPVAFLLGWAQKWYQQLQGTEAQVEMVATIILAVVMAAMYVWLFRRARSL